MKNILITFAVLMMSFSVLAMGKKIPKDMSVLNGSYTFVDCGTATPPYPIPHTIDFNGQASGNAVLVLRTNAKVLTTRTFHILEGKNQKCFDDSNYTAKCRSKLENTGLKIHVNWDCAGRLIPFMCMAITPRDYYLELEQNGALTYVQDGAACLYRRVQ